ncbi:MULTISPECIES: hypothetical protein [Cyanophyceae]|uniref:hypothetical protein n=1 Tax=Cyanophyceae TaxID=3028117 RepID=UPI0016880775|nr:hypothetical protein [Trichocoleus sp. FACHB-69]MBD1934181.1 hypothetical protein [Trichocoleus sp. FACHB-69]
MNIQVTPTIEVLNVDCMELKFQGHSLRYAGTAEDLKLVAEDLCLALRLSKTAWIKVPLEFRDLVRVYVGRHLQGLLLPEEVQTVNQNGIDYLMNSTNKRTALQFMKWFYEEALRSIHKKA